MQFILNPRNLKDARVLVTNDDGYDAEGIKLLTEIAESLAKEVWVVAPSEENSGAGHSLTVRRSIDVSQLSDRKFSVDGTPTDCVIIALNQLMRDSKPDLVLSGINRGVNIAEDVTYSGTIGAAYEAAIAGVRAIAFSQELSVNSEINWSSAKLSAADVIKKLYSQQWKADWLLNVNFPARQVNEGKIKITTQGRHKKGDDVASDKTAVGGQRYKIGAVRLDNTPQQGTDVQALKNGIISITPITINHTDNAFKDYLKGVL